MARIIHALTAIIVATVPIGLITDYTTWIVAHQATPAAQAGAVGQWRSVATFAGSSEKVSIRGVAIVSIGCDHRASIR